MVEEQAPDPRWGAPSRTHDPWLLARFRPRPSDILIVTAPKAGTTWMQQILYQIVSGGDDGFSSIYDVVPWLECPRKHQSREDTLREYEAMENPRIFKTHCTFEQTPGSGKVRIVLTSRDPRDCCISFYHHIMDMTEEGRAKAGIRAPSSFDVFFAKWMAHGAWFRNVQGWWPHRHAPNVLWLRYEDMKADLETAIDRVAAFLGARLTSVQRARVLEHCSFAWMKRNAGRFTRVSDWGGELFKPGGFIRKGQVGKERHLLTPEQEQQILRRCADMLEPECLDFLGLKHGG